MHDVSNAINILDPTEGIDKKICGDGSVNAWGNNADDPGKCKAASSQQSNGRKLSHLFDKTIGGYTEGTNGSDMMSTLPNTSAKISKDMAALNREEKGKVSSAFKGC